MRARSHKAMQFLHEQASLHVATNDGWSECMPADCHLDPMQPSSYVLMKHEHGVHVIIANHLDAYADVVCMLASQSATRVPVVWCLPTALLVMVPSMTGCFYYSLREGLSICHGWGTELSIENLLCSLVFVKNCMF